MGYDLYFLISLIKPITYTIITHIIISFIFKSIAIAGITKRRGLEGSWFAYIPMLRDTILATVVDDIYAYKRKKSKFTKTQFLLGLSILITCPVITQSNEAIVLIIVLFIAYRIYSLIVI